MNRLNALDQMPATMPCPYNGTEVSNAQLEKFISASLNQEKLPMVILGANWCADAQCLEASNAVAIGCAIYSRTL